MRSAQARRPLTRDKEAAMRTLLLMIVILASLVVGAACAKRHLDEQGAALALAYALEAVSLQGMLLTDQET